MVNATDERRRRLEVLKVGVDVALATIDEYADLLQDTVDNTYRAVTTHQLRSIMLVLEYVTEKMQPSDVAIDELARLLYRDLHAEFPDIEP